MKTTRKPYLYLAGAIALALLVWWVERPEKPKRGDVATGYLFPDFKVDGTYRLEVEHLSDGVRLVKEGTSWKVANLKGGTQGEEWFEADSARVKVALDAMAALELASLVGSNPEKHVKFEVDNIAVQVRAMNENGEKLVHLYVGKSGPDFMSTYVRKEGDDNVYLTNRYLRGSFNTEVENWREKTIWEIPQGEIQSIQVKGRESYLLGRGEDKKWKLKEPKGQGPTEEELDFAKVNNFLNQVATLEAIGFAKGAEKEILAKPELTLTLTLDTGVHEVSFLGENSAKDSFVQKKGDPQIYLLRPSLKEQLIKGWKELKTPKSPGAPAK